jgi:hypothetical protein
MDHFIFQGPKLKAFEPRKYTILGKHRVEPQSLPVQPVQMTAKGIKFSAILQVLPTSFTLSAVA